MSVPKSQRPPWWLWACPVGCSIVLGAIGYWPTRSVAGTRGLVAMFVGQAVVLAAVYVSLAATVRHLAVEPVAVRLQRALRAGLLRFLLTLFAAVVVAWRTGLPSVPLLVWVSITYVVLVQAETVALVKWMARFETGS